MRGYFGFCVVFFSVCVLFASMSVPVSLSAQPPIDTNRFVEGTTAWGPRRADPAKAYDSGSGQLIFNCYETLIAWKKELHYDFTPLLATNVPNRTDVMLAISNSSAYNVTTISGSTWTDGVNTYTCMGYSDFNSLGQGFGQGDVIYLSDSVVYRAWLVESLNDTTLTLWRGSYTFSIRTDPVIYFWNESGSSVDTFDIDDAEYSFKRGAIQDQLGSPQWMFYRALFGTMNSDPFASNTTEPSSLTLAHLIDNAIEKNGNDLTINLGIPFPDNAFKQNICNTWGSIVSKEFSTSIGCWNGDLYSDSNGDQYPDWWTTVRRVSRSPYDTTGNYRYVGTGPYRIETFNQAGNVVVMQKNPGYWRGWPAAGLSNNLDTIEIDYITDFRLRQDKFQNGEIDTCIVPRNYFVPMLDPVTWEPPEGVKYKTIKNLSPYLGLDALHFTFTINASSTLIGTGSFPNGIPTDFFNNTHTRKAFAYSLNQSEAITHIYFGEAAKQYTPLIEGLYPDYRTVTSGYDINFALAEAELKQAMFGGQSIWSSGFTLTLLYNEGSFERGTPCEMIRSFFQMLSTYDGRVGPAFTVNKGTTDWGTYLNLFETQKLPIFDIGWLADFADADNFIRLYMHSNGDFSYFQNYTLTNGWGGTRGSNYVTLNKDMLIEKAFTTPDGLDRARMYADLESIYISDCPSFPIPTPTSRKWCQYWVKGWYYNAMYPSDYFYALWKHDDCWFDISGTTRGVSDGIVNMRDISWLITHFNAKPPEAGKALDLKWIGMYGANGCVDPYGDRTCNMRDITGAILHFNHKNNTLTP